MIINTNLMSSYARNYLSQSQTRMETIMQRLSSGKRVNTSKDDAAGLAIIERMTTMIRGNEVGMRNINDGLSMVQVAEGALKVIQDQFQRIRELLIQARNGTYNEKDRLSIEKEINQIKNAIDNIAETTRFNGINLLKQTVNPNYYTEVINQIVGPLTIAQNSFITNTTTIPTVGPDVLTSNLTIRLDNMQYERYFMSVDSGPIYSDFGHPGHTQIKNVTLPKNIANAKMRVYVKGDLAPPNEWLETYVNGTRVGSDWMPGQSVSETYMGEFDISSLVSGGNQIELKTVGGNLGGDGVDGGSARYELEITYSDGTQYVEKKSLRSQLIDENGNIVTEKTATSDTETYVIDNPNAGNWRVRIFNDDIYGVSQPVTISKIFATTTEPEGFLFIHGGYEMKNQKAIMLTDTTSILNLTSGITVGSAGAIQAIDKAIDQISKERARYGSYANALQTRLDYNASSVIESTNARSRIEDANMAREAASIVKERILANSSLSMIVQANSNPERIVQLLKQ